MRLILVFIVFLFAGCVSAPDGETARLSINKDMNEAIFLIDEYTRTCWTIPASIKNDDISTRRSFEGDKVVFTIGRDNTDIPFMPFARIILIPSSAPIQVSIEEGAVSMAEPWNVDKKLSNWLNGDKSCSVN